MSTKKTNIFFQSTGDWVILFYITTESVKSRYSLSSDKNIKLSPHQTNRVRQEENVNEDNLFIYRSTIELKSAFLNENLH